MSYFKDWHPEIYKRTQKQVRPIDIIAIKDGFGYIIQFSKHKHDISEDEKAVLLQLHRFSKAIPILGWMEGKTRKFINMITNLEWNP